MRNLEELEGHMQGKVKRKNQAVVSNYTNVLVRAKLWNMANEQKAVLKWLR